MTASGVRSADSAYALLDASPSLDPGEANATLGIRRLVLMARLKPMLSPGFLAAVANSRRRHRGTGFGALAPAARLERVRNPPSLFKGGTLKTSILLALLGPRPTRLWYGDVGLVQPAFGVAKPFATMTAIAWPLCSQDGLPTCVPNAAVACIELMRQRARPPDFVGLSVRFLYDRMQAYPPADPPPGADKGYTKLGQAKDALAHDGICSKATWPETGALLAQPSAAALGEASANRVQTAVYKDYPDPATRPAGVAKIVYDELVAGRPVAIALPAFSANGDPTQPTNWTRADVMQSGDVPDPSPIDKPVPLSGHAVCVIGFQPGGADRLGGYFVFRNSVGDSFGAYAPMHDADDPPPGTPAPGYGTISAQHVEDHVWELLSLTLG